MPRYWVIAPVESKPAELFDKVWQFDLANNVISVGWKDLGDVSRMSAEELASAVASTYPEKPPNIHTLWANMIWDFYHEISPGDIIIARRGLKVLAGVGKVVGRAVYDPGKSPVNGHPNFLEVAWDEQPRNKSLPTVVFQRRTVVELPEGQYLELVQGSAPIQQATPFAERIEDPNEFVLEKYLEDFIVSNFDAIFKGKLNLYEETEEGEGQQYDTDEIGRIDILAVEPQSRAFVVIELKKGRPSDQVVGQTLRYMGWVKKNLCADGQAVRGLIICRDHEPRLSYALEMTKYIEVRYYSVSFKLRESP